jgi:hypothetical protein
MPSVSLGGGVVGTQISETYFLKLFAVIGQNKSPKSSLRTSKIAAASYYSSVNTSTLVSQFAVKIETMSPKHRQNQPTTARIRPPEEITQVFHDKVMDLSVLP